MAESIEGAAPPEQSDTQPAGRKLAHAAIIEVVAYVVQIGVRLGSNLVLTRLLFPEAFGLMSLTQSILYVLWMLSDVGLSQAVVMSKRGDDPRFLDTAFTLQAIRGVGLWVLLVLLAWPLAQVYAEPQLLWLLPFGSFTTVIHGLSSPRVFLLRRQVKPAALMLLTVTCQAVGVGTNIAGAYMGFGVASLVAGGLVATVVETIWSHYLPGSTHRVKFRIEPEARHEILHFGRWIFASSSLTSLSQRGDQLLLGRLLGAAGLGIYQIALTLAELPEALATNVVNGVIYPTLARVRNEAPESFADAYYQIRLWLDPLMHVSLGGLIGMSDWIIALLYDDRYLGAASMMRVLAIRASLQLLSTVCETCFLARGESKYGFRRNLFVTIMLMIAMPVGHYLDGVQGVLWGSVVARSMALVALWPDAHKRGFLRLSRELLVVPYVGAGYGLGLLFAYLLPDF